MMLPTSAFAREAGAAVFGAVFCAIRLNRKPSPYGDYRSNQYERDGHDLENGFHERSNGSIALFDNHIGTVLPWRSGYLQKRQRTMVSQINDIGLILENGVISLASQQQETSRCKTSSIACHLQMRFTAVAGLLRDFWQGSQCRLCWSVCSSCRFVDTVSWKRRLSLHRSTPTSETSYPFGSSARDLPC